MKLMYAWLLACVCLLNACTPHQPEFKSIDLTGADYAQGFDLVDASGQRRQLSDFKGKVVAIFFGYTYCPDVCPTTMGELAMVMNELGKDADRVQVLFITVDPERDTPEALKDYLSNFDPRIIGLTGPRPQLEPMLREYRIYAKRAPGNGEDYAVDHTTVVYLMDKNGRFVNAFNVSRKPYEAARELAIGAPIRLPVVDDADAQAAGMHLLAHGQSFPSSAAGFSATA